MRLVAAAGVTVALLSFLWGSVSTDLSSVATCAAREFLDGPRTSWQCRVHCVQGSQEGVSVTKVGTSASDLSTSAPEETTSASRTGGGLGGGVPSIGKKI